jgi:murein DD-endopeptidase MepM/ murein hydrolase activator NlpD
MAGTTGSSTGRHLHFEVMVDGSYVDPMDWIS